MIAIGRFAYVQRFCDGFQGEEQPLVKLVFGWRHLRGSLNEDIVLTADTD